MHDCTAPSPLRHTGHALRHSALLLLEPLGGSFVALGLSASLERGGILRRYVAPLLVVAALLRVAAVPRRDPVNLVQLKTLALVAFGASAEELFARFASITDAALLVMDASTYTWRGGSWLQHPGEIAPESW